ncbi:MAG: esterase-like activity of phytase family protein, partial [Haloplanus sp.]
MDNNTGSSRRRVLQISSGLLGAGILSSVGTASRANTMHNGHNATIPGVTDITFYDVDGTGLNLGDVDVPGGETVSPVAAIGSGAFAAPSDGQPEFYAVADSGPGFDCDEAEAVTGRSGGEICGENASGSIRPIPEYTPTIYRMTLNDDERVTLSGTTPLTDSNGAEINTLTNPLSNGTEQMFTVGGDEIPHDPNGVDVEGVARTAEGTFWLSEEYAPSLIKLDASGEVLARYVPETLESDLSEATYPVVGTLPEVFKRRDRGIESVGLAPDDSTVYFAHQSPLANPDVAAFEESRNLRLGAFDPESETVSDQYLYRLDDPGTFRKDSDAGEVAQDDVKVSEISVVDDDRLLVLERISQTTKFYVVDLAAATPIPDGYDELSARPTLAQVDPETDSALM